MSKKDRMKFGLDSLFADNNNNDDEKSGKADGEASSAEESAAGGLMTVRLSMVEPDKKQPRKEFDEAAISELADNISHMGVLQPLLVRPAAAAGRYTIVAGERRWRAARLAGLTEIPVIVRDMSEVEAAQIALIENVQREDLNPIDEARGYKRLAEEFGMAHEDIALAVGKSRPMISNMIRILDMPEEMIGAVHDGTLSVGHAKVLCAQKEDIQQRLFKEIVNRKLSVRDTEKLLKDILKGKASIDKGVRVSKRSSDSRITEYSLSMKEEYGVEPKFTVKADKSVVMKISFKDKNELAEFMKKLS